MQDTTVSFHEPPPSGVGNILALAAMVEQGDEAARQQALDFMSSPTAAHIPAGIRGKVQDALDAHQFQRTNARRRRVAGKCKVSKCTNIPEPDRARCRYHLEREREIERRSKARKRERGECEDCGNPWTHRNGMVCDDCREKRNIRRLFLKKDMRDARITRLRREPDYADINTGLYGDVMSAMVTGATVDQAISAGADPRHFARAIVKGIITITLPNGQRWTPLRPELWRDPERLRPH